MAELLVRAKGHWMDGWNAAKVASLSVTELQSYNARTQLGDIVVIRPDGWEWGGEECLPNFIVVKVVGLSYEDAKHLEESLSTYDGEKRILLKAKKWQVPVAWVNNRVAANESVVTITLKPAQTQFINNLIEKLN